MNSGMMRSLGVAAACLSLAATAVAEDDSAKEQSAQAAANELLTSRVAVGYRINPVELRLRGKNLFLVGLGSYLVNAGGGCNDCHTHPSFAPGGDPFKGETEIINTAQFLTGGRQFGPITSANITPDENGRPAGLTFEEFEHLLRTGRDEGGEILQVMPWNVYGKMTRFDLRAIYEYLSAIPSLPDNPEPGP
jgi:mono/diheme cytochrome c family protein